MFEGVDLASSVKLTSDLSKLATCVECCKYYIAPETASCGHTVCHSCWKGRRTCHICAAPVKKCLKLNIPLQNRTENIHDLVQYFEKLFKLKLGGSAPCIPDDLQTTDPTRNVKEWLASSQNHFSGPAISSQASENELIPPIELSKSKITIHSHSKKLSSPLKVVHPLQPQEDWDKIEVLPDTDVTNEKPKDHIVGPMDFEPFMLDDIEYTTDNPRRSSRKKDSNPPTRELSFDKNSGKNSSNTENKSLKTKQTWSNVKKMRKEFSKLNKKNNSKLNVSIEMCKKAQSVAKPKHVTELVEPEPLCLTIDDSTPDVKNIETKSQQLSKRLEEEKINIDNTNIGNKLNLNEKDQESNRSILKQLNKELNNDDHFQAENEIVKAVSKTDTKKSEPTNSVVNNETNKTQLMPFIKKSALCKKSAVPNIEENNIEIIQNENDSNTIRANTDDIEISIKIGNTITNIVIRNKKNDVQMKVNTDREVQTSLGPHGLNNKCDASCSPLAHNKCDVSCSPVHNIISVQNIELQVDEGNKVKVTKSLSTKKNTASADTATVTVPFEITDSVDKELSDVMECLETKNVKKSTQKPITKMQVREATQGPAFVENLNDIPQDVGDIDIFNSGSVKETTVKLLKDSKYAASEILPTSTAKKSKKNADKRDREDIDEVELPINKKQKIDSIIFDNANEKESSVLQDKNLANDSENMNYDVIMSQVFANIDAEIKNNDSKVVENASQDGNQKGKETISEIQQKAPAASQIIHKTQVLPKNKSICEAQNNSQVNEIVNQKFSENMFSMLEKDTESLASGRNKKLPVKCSTQQQIDNLLTPGMCREMAVIEDNADTQADNEIEMMEPQLGTPMIEHDDDSDKSVVEETPQKNISLAKTKQTETVKLTNRNKSLSRNLQVDAENRQNINRCSDSQIIRSIINISDTVEDNKDNKTNETTVVEMPRKTQTLETPLNINKFVNQITHNSTPIARKSLNFENDNLDDPEQTLCPTTTQEKEIIDKAFEKTPQSPIRRPLQRRNVSLSRTTKNIYIAGSCLTSAEVRELKRLCLERKWTFLDKYTDELTHLVVGVDEENKSQRSVKYMCALAASKWIVNYDWVVKCLESRTNIVDEVSYEALDACGEPGPRRSRIALKKVFEGITFFCMPPFSVLDIATLKLMLTAAGGRVVDSANGVTVTESNRFKPALLLAEPEHTQEDKFIFMAMEHKLVPVNYEWVLNCLGTYSLCSIHELLLCPPSLLPPETARWPASMMRQEEDD